MAAHRVILLFLLCVVLIHARTVYKLDEPARSSNSAAVSNVRSAADAIGALQKRYTAVKSNATQLITDLNAAVQAGKLTKIQIQVVAADLQADIFRAVMINSDTLMRLNACWSCIGVSVACLEACQWGVVAAETAPVGQLEVQFLPHKATALKLLN
ncbi:putative 24.3 kDa protein [Frankliniella fusca]|uniref:24.3 kDa protein n=1 Tax=Frankliniella fusca TaxID=407009 RepID=A0AAE1I2P9_9NEOP|nr:putative 24.3 kDa protein [Frankliniella fusca]